VYSGRYSDQARSTRRTNVRIPGWYLACTSAQHQSTILSQTLLTGGVATADSGKSVKGKEKVRENSTGSDTASSTPPSGAPAAKKILSQHKVRTSGADRTLDSMFLPTPTQSGAGDNAGARHGVDVVKERRKTREIPQSICYLTSVLALRENVKNAKHKGVKHLITDPWGHG
jgi:DNA mismatch repair protein MLH1